MLASFQDFVVFWAIKKTGISRMFVLGAPQNAEKMSTMFALQTSQDAGLSRIFVLAVLAKNAEISGCDEPKNTGISKMFVLGT